MSFESKIEINQLKQHFMCEKNFVTDYVLFWLFYFRMNPILTLRNQFLE